MRVGKLLVAILVASHLVNFTLGQATSFCNPKPLKCTGTTTTLDRSSNPFDGIDVEWGAKPVAVDWDGDGDIDLLVGHQDGRIQFFERTADASLVERTGSSNPCSHACCFSGWSHLELGEPTRGATLSKLVTSVLACS
ncbi:unnamed protein product [Polarella glacialis]|uniref:Uncharacterized protein n=1 Tax=Polarella glacialis TaxID=89957 RepID=A0A813HM96_POLGL|nr:unnamed protein product [Polarella glacialis]